jgi:phage tail protein X
VESSCELGNEPSGSINCWETTEWRQNLWSLEWYSTSQSELVHMSWHMRRTVFASAQAISEAALVRNPGLAHSKQTSLTLTVRVNI